MGGGGSRRPKSSESIQDEPVVESFEHVADTEKKQTKSTHKHRTKWPLPPKEELPTFTVNSVIADYNYKISDSVGPPTEPNYGRYARQMPTNLFLSNEARGNRVNQERDMSVYESANVRVLIDSKSNSWTGMNSSPELNQILGKLHTSHGQFDDIVQQRLQGLSREGERILESIIVETKQEHQRLIDFAQSIQSRQDQLYREWLAKYVAELDKWRAEQLEELKTSAELSRREIDEVFHQKLVMANEKIEEKRSEIFEEEHKRQATETKNLLTTSQALIRDNRMDNFRAEAYTDVRVQVTANAGDPVKNENAINQYTNRQRPSHLRNFV